MRVAAMNLYGIGPASPSMTFKTAASEVEITGSATQEDRDVELRKHAWLSTGETFAAPPAYQSLGAAAPVMRSLAAAPVYRSLGATPAEPPPMPTPLTRQLGCLDLDNPPEGVVVF